MLPEHRRIKKPQTPSGGAWDSLEEAAALGDAGGAATTVTISLIGRRCYYTFGWERLHPNHSRATDGIKVMQPTGLLPAASGQINFKTDLA
jgi:hypothetical protein